MNHYDLCEAFPEETTSDDWKAFLSDPEVIDWLRSELSILQEAELKKLIKDVSSSRSVGQAQLMSTLSKLNENKVEKEGPAFIYTYVPLNDQEKSAPNATILDKDVFKDEA